jgi:hypothetical protein
MMEVPFPQKLARLDQERLRAYRENLAFYQGLQWPGPSRRRERRLIFNYSRVFVDKLTSYLMSGLTIAVEPWDSSVGAGERARRAEEALREVRDQNYLEQLDFDTETDCAVLGDGCYKITWDGTGARVTPPPMSRASLPGGCRTIWAGCGEWPAATASQPRRWHFYTVRSSPWAGRRPLL